MKCKLCQEAETNQGVCTMCQDNLRVDGETREFDGVVYPVSEVKGNYWYVTGTSVDIYDK